MGCILGGCHRSLNVYSLENAMIRLLSILCLCLAGCATNAPVRAWTSGERNACLPEAIAMRQGLAGAGIQAKVLAIQTPTWGHAVTAYLYPTGQNRLWVWSADWKSLRVRAFFNDPNQIARAWMSATGRDIPITSAYFIF